MVLTQGGALRTVAGPMTDYDREVARMNEDVDLEKDEATIKGRHKRPSGVKSMIPSKQKRVG